MIYQEHIGMQNDHTPDHRKLCQYSMQAFVIDQNNVNARVGW